MKRKIRDITKVSDKEKIDALERVLRAVFGRPETDIRYRTPYEGAIEIMLECDVDDALKVIIELSMNDIQSSFFVDERKLSEEDQKFWGKEWEGFDTIHLFVEPQPWRENIELNKEIKELKKKLGSLRSKE